MVGDGLRAFVLFVERNKRDDVRSPEDAYLADGVGLISQWSLCGVGVARALKGRISGGRSGGSVGDPRPLRHERWEHSACW